MRIKYTKANNLAQLHDELAAALPSLLPVDGASQLIVEGEGEDIWLTVPDDFTDKAALDAVVAAHTPQAPKLPPDWSKFFTAALASPAYARVANQTNLEKFRDSLRLEILLSLRPKEVTQYQTLKQLWDKAVTGLLPALSGAEIAELNQIASDNNMPFSIAADGTMQLT